MKTSGLTGAALDWAVCKAAGIPVIARGGILFWSGTNHIANPSTSWSLGGPIIEREEISISHCKHGIEDTDAWWATDGPTGEEETLGLFGPTPLIAAMRCYVASKLGDEVDVPEELK